MNITEKAKNIIDNCRFCWMCRHVCPIGNATGLERNTARRIDAEDFAYNQANTTLSALFIKSDTPGESSFFAPCTLVPFAGCFCTSGRLNNSCLSLPGTENFGNLHNSGR